MNKYSVGLTSLLLFFICLMFDLGWKEVSHSYIASFNDTHTYTHTHTDTDADHNDHSVMSRSRWNQHYEYRELGDEVLRDFKGSYMDLLVDDSMWRTVTTSSTSSSSTSSSSTPSTSSSSTPSTSTSSTPSTSSSSSTPSTSTSATSNTSSSNTVSNTDSNTASCNTYSNNITELYTVQSRILTGPMFITENPAIRIRYKSISCTSPVALLKDLLSPDGVSALSPLVPFTSPFTNPISHSTLPDNSYMELRDVTTSLVWPLQQRNLRIVSGINWTDGFLFSRSISSFSPSNHPPLVDSNGPPLSYTLMVMVTDADGKCYTNDNVQSSMEKCEVQILSHSAGIIPYPIIAHYYNSDFLPQRIYSFLSKAN